MITILFNSFAFLYFSIAVFLGLLILKHRDYQYLFLLAASYFFYYYSSGLIFVLIIYITLLNYYCAKGIFTAARDQIRKTYFIVGIIGSLSILALFKYTNFSIKTINVLGGWLGYPADLPFLHLILPIGISFYAFQAVSYLTDVYRKKMEPEKSLLKFSLYMAFFPHLLAGPIVRAAHFLPQLTLERIKITADNFKRGVTLIMWGLVKKAVIADNIAQFVIIFFQDPTQYPGSLPVILGAIGFAIQVYCDFSGYTDIAIGLARVVGIDFPLNFDKPFFSRSIAEFWKRWHISLSNWFRDYLFHPLMSLRKGISMWWLYCSIFIVYLVSGLWHGAGWNFVVWGALHGVFLMVGMMTERWRIRFHAWIGLTKIPRVHNFIKIMVTLYLVVFSLLLFRLYNAKNIMYTARNFLFPDLSQWSAQLDSLLPAFQISFFFIVVFMVIHIYTYFRRDTLKQIADKGIFEWIIYLLGMCLILYFFSASGSTPFVYFQF